MASWSRGWFRWLACSVLVACGARTGQDLAAPFPAGGSGGGSSGGYGAGGGGGVSGMGGACTAPACQCTDCLSMCVCTGTDPGSCSTLCNGAGGSAGSAGTWTGGTGGTGAFAGTGGWTGGFGGIGATGGSAGSGGFGAIGGTGGVATGGTGGLGICTSPPDTCTQCLCGACNTSLNSCFSGVGCSLILDCMGRTSCLGYGCYQANTCKDVIDAFGGFLGQPNIDANSLLLCVFTSGCQCG